MQRLTAEKYRAGLEALHIVAGFRSLVAPADEEGYWNEILAPYDDAIERAEHITTEQQLQTARVTARLRGLLPYACPLTLPGAASPGAGNPVPFPAR